ncbi:hypothetical protein TorRG33x02_185820 [Trema orientale]|uniref:Uncharacterized protein n=1 Tax=Trema orientale TaxID=63057 RepID=A0A2P5EJ54_TREOI|nr:hypothetical protein TorRG33x02_185820 [Trema orientale]
MQKLKSLAHSSQILRSRTGGSKKIGFDIGEPCLGTEIDQDMGVTCDYFNLKPPMPLAGFGDDGEVERLLRCCLT